MITIKLSGGLGNQMFQYAIGKALSDKYKTELLIDESFLINRFSQNDFTYREYELEFFGITKKLNFVSKIFNRFSFLNKIINVKILYIINKLIYFKNYVKEIDGNYIKNISNNVYLDGYWQSYKYFEDIKKDLVLIFEVKTKLSQENKKILDLINENFLNSVSVHIRRGDYITNSNANSWHGVCSMDYYRDALKYIMGKINNPYFFVFSDDISWVKENMDFGENVCFVDNNDGKGHEDLRLMYSCGNHIIANSSFSWWGAYLGKNENKIVIAPKKWLQNDKYTFDNLIPKDWIKI